jgi:hypothetical protein
MRSFSYQLFSVRDIANGEELTYQYTHVSCSAAERRKELVPYDFFCACPACTDAAASDVRRTTIEAFSPNVLEWVLDPKLADDWFVAQCLKHLALIVQEGLEHLPQHYSLVKALMEAHICLGDAQAASEGAAKLGRFLWAEPSEDFKTLKTLVDSDSAAYKKHPMWCMRFDNASARVPFSSGENLFKDFAALALKNGGKTGRHANSHSINEQ